MNDIPHTPKNLWHTTKKVARFTWRYFFTIILLVMAVDFILEATSVNYLNMLGTFAIAAFIDWLKCLKGKGSNNSHEQMLAYARSENDSCNVGSAAWRANPMAIGSPANHLYNLGSTNKYY
jgi:hypothetical protein